MPARRTAVIVLGMHRSGTSAVTGATIRLGFAPPRTLLPSTVDNPTGFHESLPIDRMDHLILNALGQDWFHCLNFDPDTLDAAAQAAALDSCVAILRQEYADAPAFVLKDPLMCLTVPIWLAALRAIGAAVSVLIVARHPDEVANSLYRRDRLPSADTTAVWLHYVLEAERLTRGLPRAVVLYTDLLRDWRGCMARAGATANIVWPLPPWSMQPGRGEVVIGALRHHVAAGDPVTVGKPPIRDLASEAWQAVGQLRDETAFPFAHNRLDYARACFARCRASAHSREIA